MTDVTNADNIQQRCAGTFLRRMKPRPATRKRALKPLSEALMAGQAWMFIGKSGRWKAGKRNQKQRARETFSFPAFHFPAFRFYVSSWLALKPLDDREQIWPHNIRPIHPVATRLKNAAQAGVFVDHH